MTSRAGDLGSSPHISVVIPCHNERTRLPPTLAELRVYFEARSSPFEIIVVDSASTDGTAEIATQVLQPLGPAGVVIASRQNAGKGSAVRRGMLAASGRIVLFTDADLSTPIAELSKLEAALVAGADVAIGSRAADRRLLEVPQGQGRDLAGRLFNVVARTFATPGIWDTQCGFKLFRAEAARQIFTRQRLNGFGFDVELVALARHLGLALVEVPVRWRNDPDSRVTLVRGAQAFLDPVRVWASLWTGRYGPPARAVRRSPATSRSIDGTPPDAHAGSAPPR